MSTSVTLLTSKQRVNHPKSFILFPHQRSSQDTSEILEVGELQTVLWLDKTMRISLLCVNIFRTLSTNLIPLYVIIYNLLVYYCLFLGTYYVCVSLVKLKDLVQTEGKLALTRKPNKTN